jgi:hypothetical protein
MRPASLLMIQTRLKTTTLRITFKYTTATFQSLRMLTLNLLYSWLIQCYISSEVNIALKMRAFRDVGIKH